MYKAIIEVGGYKVGEEVPTDKAEFWNKVFAVPHAKKVDEEDKKFLGEEKKPKVPKDKAVGFYNELMKIKGIAWRTAEDIVEVFTKEELINAISKGEKLPFRNDIGKKLRVKYGK